MESNGLELLHYLPLRSQVRSATSDCGEVAVLAKNSRKSFVLTAHCPSIGLEISIGFFQSLYIIRVLDKTITHYYCSLTLIRILVSLVYLSILETIPCQSHLDPDSHHPVSLCHLPSSQGTQHLQRKTRISMALQDITFANYRG